MKTRIQTMIKMRYAAAFLAACMVLSVPRTVAAATATLAPAPYQTVADSSGAPISGACVWTYQAGTSTPAETYTSKAATVANSNPITTDASGQFVAYLLPGQSYKFVYETACIAPAHGSVLRTQDGIDAVPASANALDVTGTAGENIGAGLCAYLSVGSGGKQAGQFYLCDSANAYSSTAPIVGLAPSAIAIGATGTIRLLGSVPGLTALTIGSTYYAGTAGAITATAPTLARNLGVADTTTSLILDSVPAQPVVQTTTVTGTQNDFALSTGVTLLRVNNATAVTFTGFAAGVDGQTVTIVSIGAGQVNVTPQSAGSVAANRAINFATVGNTPLAAGAGTATYTYDATTARWRLVAHDQGAWITPTYAAGDYTASGGGAWTVDAGDVTTFAYMLRGRTLTITHELVATTVATVAPTTLLATVPGGFSAAKQAGGAMVCSDAGANDNWGKYQVLAAATSLRYTRGVGVGVWTLGANATTVSATITMEVQ